MNGYLKFRFFGQRSSRYAVPVFLLLIGGFISFLAVVGCKKESAAHLPQAESSVGGTTLIPSCSDPLPANTVLELIRTPDDPTNDRINMMLYHYGQALRVVTQNPTYLCYLETAMLADTGGIGVSLYSLAQENTSFSQALNSALRQSMTNYEIYPRGEEEGIESSIADPGWDANAFLRGKMEYVPYKYEPVVYFIKRPVECVPSIQPTIVIAQDVNDCDDVAGWRGSNEVLVSEDEANTSSEPIIFVGPGLGVYQSTSFTGGVNQVILTGSDLDESTLAQNEQGASDRSDIVSLYQIKAGYRYESGARSEIVGWRTTFTPATRLPFNLLPWAGFNPRKIHKNDINASTVFTDMPAAFPLPLSVYTSGTWVFYGTWESDWWASVKTIVNPCSVWVDHSVNVKMKYSHEWYFFNCGVASSLWPATGSTWGVNNAKCRFILRRTI